MNRIAKALAPALLLVAPSALVAQAQDEGLLAYVSFGQNIAYNHALTMTGSPWGGPGCYLAEFGLQFYHPVSTLLWRPNVGYTRLLSKNPDDPGIDSVTLLPKEPPTLYDVMGMFVGFDLVYNMSKKLPLTLTAGPSFHAWTIEQTTNVPGGYRDRDKRQQGERSLKLGWRIAAGYDFKVRGFPLRVDFGYTMTEWRSRDNVEYIEGLNPSYPSYLTLKVSHTFDF
jgi:hypothetical protein